MARKTKLPDSLTIATRVLPPTPLDDPPSMDLMDMVKEINAVGGQLRQVINQSGNGHRFKETRDLLMRDLANRVGPLPK